MKSNNNWSKLDGEVNLIWIKKVDWTMFEGGSVIPRELHENFDNVNGYKVDRGSGHSIYLIYESIKYEARIYNIGIKNEKSQSYKIRYDSNEELKKILKESFKFSYKYLKKERLKGNKRPRVSDETAEYIEFYSTGKPFVYEIKLVSHIVQEEVGDYIYQKEVEKSTKSSVSVLIDDVPVDKPLKNDKTTSKGYKRNGQKGKNAIADAEYLCEVDNKHKDFTSKVTGENYVEAHHLIPIEYQDSFDVSIDVEANIISLCVGCHRKLHHAVFEEIEPIIRELYKKRKERLNKCNIGLEFETLMEMYQ